MAARKPKGKPALARHPGGRPTKYEPRFAAMLEDFMGQGYSATAFAGHIGVSRSTIDEWKQNFTEFSEALSRAKAKRLLHWEGAALRVSVKGGGPGTATIIAFGLKNMGDDEWRDRQQLEHSGPNGGPIKTEEVSARERIARRIAGLAPGG